VGPAYRECRLRQAPNDCAEILASGNEAVGLMDGVAQPVFVRQAVSVDPDRDEPGAQRSSDALSQGEWDQPQRDRWIAAIAEAVSSFSREM
jgi:hypothetical protein